MSSTQASTANRLVAAAQNQALLLEIQKHAEANAHAVADSVAKGTQETDARLASHSEATEWTTAVLSLKTKFHDIKEALRIFDVKRSQALGSPTDSGSPQVEALEPLWEQLVTGFKRLLQLSQARAQSGASIAQEYRDKVLSAVEKETFTDLEFAQHMVKRLRDHLESLAKDGESGASVSQAVDKVRADITAFKTKLQGLVGDGQLKTERQAVVTRAQTVEADVKHWVEVAHQAVEATVRSLGAEVTSAATAVTSLSPVGWATAVSKGFKPNNGGDTWAPIHTKLSDLKKDLEDAQKKAQDHLQLDVEIAKVQGAIQAAEAEFSKIVEKFDIFGRLHTIFATDASSLLSNTLEMLTDRRSTASAALKSQAKLSEAAYSVLQDNLQAYSTQLAAAPQNK